mmetsp:Transcript_6496/g.8517  ORF Transcript_6496/g.8517 Transcript_6496/m.8517 type:complete len:203 (+) Transcript_6496:839-1447(+)
MKVIAKTKPKSLIDSCNFPNCSPSTNERPDAVNAFAIANPAPKRSSMSNRIFENDLDVRIISPGRWEDGTKNKIRAARQDIVPSSMKLVHMPLISSQAYSSEAVRLGFGFSHSPTKGEIPSGRATKSNSIITITAKRYFSSRVTGPNAARSSFIMSLSNWILRLRIYAIDKTAQADIPINNAIGNAKAIHFANVTPSASGKV